MFQQIININKWIRIHFNVTILFTIKVPSMMLSLDDKTDVTSKGASIITITT